MSKTPAIQHSGIYHGWVRHRRFTPRAHAFTYRVFMMYLDTREIDLVMAKSRFWSSHRWALARYKRSDFLGDQNTPLDTAVRREIFAQTGQHHTGPVRVLTNLRYFGFIINPITTYYCFDEQEHLSYIVAEVTNTPWRERIQYVLPCDPKGEPSRNINNSENIQRFTFNKGMHVSPFNPMDMQYQWRSNLPGKRLTIDLTCTKDAKEVMDATLSLQREAITTAALNKVILRYPWMTAKVSSAIYWQALKLWLKRVPLFRHANKVNANKTYVKSND
ncbi:DUF1365 domain-containing protein [Gilvimarinus agarilyticus]|uniref:DUF1365 domain-containing protein n=1 Tax=Gilvimarinus agarilyticus TaxID=679259 RepID=UPI00059F74B5|nr:DUF1365 domain-containing protein [Gilvimarinus agarilyticus]